MPRPKSKNELLELSTVNYKKLLELVDSYEDANKNFRIESMNRNIRDVLAHLHHWHTMMKSWYEIGMKGGKPDMPAKGYKWKDTASLNRKIWEIYQDHSLEAVRTLLAKSHKEIQQIMYQHTNEELFEKKKYRWTGSTSVGAYLVSNTSSHYDWAIRLIKKGMK